MLPRESRKEASSYPGISSVSPSCNRMAAYHKAGLLYLKDGRVLLCRKKHTTSLLILPGGKLEPGETAEECLRRECREELGEVEVSNLHYLGDYQSSAAGQDSKTKDCVVRRRARRY